MHATSAAVAIALAALGYPVPALSSGSYVIVIDAVAAAGGGVNSANFTLSSLAGQPLVVGPVSSASYALQGGFYSIHKLEELLASRNTSLIYDSAALYAGFDGAGIWKSTDQGATWNAATTQPATLRIRALAIHPVTRSKLFAASFGGGVFTSTDSGANWSACGNGGLSGAALNTVALAIDSGGRLYLGTEAGIFGSADCAAWSALNSGLTVDAAKPPLALAVDGATPSVVYAGLDGAGVFKSSNSGGTWSAVATQPGNLRVQALAIKPGDSSTLYAATYGGGVFKSTNTALPFDASKNGVAWSNCDTSTLSNLNVVSLAMNPAGKLYAGTEAGVFVSIDGCTTWSAVNTGLPN